jgi:hypothetical protein
MPAFAEPAADAPQQGPPQAGPTQPVDSIMAPEIAFPMEPVTPAELFYQSVDPKHEGEKPSIYTDMSIGLTFAAPTPIEQTKLEMARAAVEAARAAGTLEVVPNGLSHTDPSPEAEQAKQAALRAPSASLPPDPAAGSGVSIQPIQETGPSGLTPVEIQKLAEQAKGGGAR